MKPSIKILLYLIVLSVAIVGILVFIGYQDLDSPFQYQVP
jgi:hypothetical protein